MLSIFKESPHEACYFIHKHAKITVNVFVTIKLSAETLTIIITTSRQNNTAV